MNREEEEKQKWMLAADADDDIKINEHKYILF